MATINISRNKIRAASYFMSAKDVRFYLCGMLLESNPMQSRVVATDGHALFAACDDAKGDNEGSFVGIIPADAIKQILAWKAPFKSYDAPVVFTTSETEQRATWGNQVCIFKLIDAKFPDYARVIPTKVSGEAAQFNPDLLIRCKKAAEALGRADGAHAFKQGGAGSALATFSAEALAVVMPWRGELANVDDAAWARLAV